MGDDAKQYTIALVGEKGVGKTCIIDVLLGNNFRVDNVPTDKIEAHDNLVPPNGSNNTKTKNIGSDIKDFPGKWYNSALEKNEHGESLTQSGREAFEDVNAIIFIVSLDKGPVDEQLKNWNSLVQKVATSLGKSFPCFCIVNKVEANDDNTEESDKTFIQQIEQSNQFHQVFTCSAKTDDYSKVASIFSEIVNQLDEFDIHDLDSSDNASLTTNKDEEEPPTVVVTYDDSIDGANSTNADNNAVHQQLTGSDSSESNANNRARSKLREVEFDTGTGARRTRARSPISRSRDASYIGALSTEHSRSSENFIGIAPGRREDEDAMSGSALDSSSSSAASAVHRTQPPRLTRTQSRLSSDFPSSSAPKNAERQTSQQTKHIPSENSMVAAPLLAEFGDVDAITNDTADTSLASSPTLQPTTPTTPPGSSGNSSTLLVEENRESEKENVAPPVITAEATATTTLTQTPKNNQLDKDAFLKLPVSERLNIILVQNPLLSIIYTRLMLDRTFYQVTTFNEGPAQIQRTGINLVRDPKLTTNKLEIASNYDLEIYNLLVGEQQYNFTQDKEATRTFFNDILDKLIAVHTQKIYEDKKLIKTSRIFNIRVSDRSPGEHLKDYLEERLKYLQKVKYAIAVNLAEIRPTFNNQPGSENPNQDTATNIEQIKQAITKAINEPKDCTNKQIYSTVIKDKFLRELFVNRLSLEGKGKYYTLHEKRNAEGKPICICTRNGILFFQDENLKNLTREKVKGANEVNSQLIHVLSTKGEPSAGLSAEEFKKHYIAIFKSCIDSLNLKRKFIQGEVLDVRDQNRIFLPNVLPRKNLEELLQNRIDLLKRIIQKLTSNFNNLKARTASQSQIYESTGESTTSFTSLLSRNSNTKNQSASQGFTSFDAALLDAIEHPAPTVTEQANTLSGYQPA